MFKSIVAYSEDPFSSEAAKDLIQSARQDLDGLRPVAGILYVYYQMDASPIAVAIRQAWPGIELIGCSSEGNISSTGGYMQYGVVLMLFVTDTIMIRATVCRNLSNDAEESASRAIAGVLHDGEKAAFCIALPESLTIGGDAVIAALQAALTPGVPVFGGLSADNWSMDSTYQVYKEEVLHDAAPLLVFIDAPTLKFSSGVKSGWDPLDGPGVVTNARGNLVFEINGEPAVEFYKHYFGAKFQVLGEFPLLVEENGREYLRAPLLSDDETGAITFAGDVPEKATVRITTAKQDVIIKAVKEAVNDAISGYQGKPDAALIYTCAARHYVLGPKTQLEVDRSLEAIGPDVPVAGFYTFGEFSPGPENRSVCMHNETFTVLLVGEVDQ